MERRTHGEQAPAVDDAGDWLVERLVPGGDGFARLPDGRAAFAAGALPGDRIRPLRIERRKGYVRALAWRLIEAGAERIEAPCKLAERCGGCDFMALGVEAQRTAKCSMLREAMRRVGGFRELPADLIVKSIGPSLGYRTRVRLHVDEQGRLGLFARGSHDLIELDECLVCHAGVNDALRRLRRIVGSNRESLAEFAQVEIRVPEGGEHALLVFAPRAAQARLSPGASALLARLREAFGVSLAGSSSAELVRHTLPGGLELRVPASSFEQINWSVNRALVARVVELSTQHRIDRFVELYAGAGNFTLPLLAAGTRGVAIEGNAAAATALAESAASSGYALTVLSGDVRRHLAALRKRGEHADLVLLDPPRAGAREVLADLITLAPAHVAFCSCDPVTLARDLRVLCAASYELSVLEGYDMFPQTHHLESLAWLSRR